MHRDLKPENILFNAKGEALLADFGIAKMLDTIGVRQGTIISTPSYMAPEQFRGLASRESDQYALGCIAYELFTGRQPFIAPDMAALMFKHLMEQPVTPRQVNAQLPECIEQAVLKALAKEREGRYEEALGAYEQAIGLDPRGHDAYWYKSRILEQLGRTGEARRAHAKARQIVCRELY